MRIAVVCAANTEAAFIRSFVGRLRPDYYIACDRGLMNCLDAGIVPDCIVGDYDSLSTGGAEGGTDSMQLLEKYRSEGRRVRVYPSEKDFSDSEAGMREAIHILKKNRLISGEPAGNAAENGGEPRHLHDSGEDEIYLLGATGGRLDHFLANLAVLMIPVSCGIRAFLADDRNEITLLSEPCILEKEKTFGKYVSLIPYTDEVRGVTLKGFKYPLDNWVLTKDNSLGLSNELNDERGLIAFDKGILILVLSKD